MSTRSAHTVDAVRPQAASRGQLRRNVEQIGRRFPHRRIERPGLMILGEQRLDLALRASELCALDDALNALARMDPRRAQVIELRFFGGLSVEETAGVLQISPQSILRDWKLARAWLTRELRH